MIRIRFSKMAILVCLTAAVVALPGGPPTRAQAPAQLTCPSCEDYNQCNVDSCDTTTGTCRHDPLSCDDGNPCTNDTCTPYGSPGGCHHNFLAAGSVCNDGAACTGGDMCDGSGHCVGQASPAGSACDDGNVCTHDDICSAAGVCAGTAVATGAECDDGDTCTTGERCVAQADGSLACRGPARDCDDGSLCTIDSCERITGECVHAPVNCDDGNPCTDDACNPATGACERTMRTSGSCDDKNICTVSDACVDGNCVGGGPGNCGWGTQCGSSICVPDQQRCLTDTNPSRCGTPPFPECGNHYDCLNGSCSLVQGNNNASCDSDGNPCTVDRCVRGGCTTQIILTSACNDGNPCTLNDVCCGIGSVGCPAGQCHGTPVCSDGDACTDDACDTATGVCGAHTPRNCDDGNPCTADSCDPVTGCRHDFITAACDDHNACTSGDVCTNGQCVGTIAVTCRDDGNPCTVEECDAATGACVSRNGFGNCDDGNPCTVNDFCSQGSCVAGSPKFCSDGNPCTADTCDVAAGGACRNTPVDIPCNDNNACTVNDRCVAGSCQPGPPANCDDGNQCTTDRCSALNGCFHDVLTGTCDDGNPCTTGDSCVQGVCKPSAAVSCVDGDACTIDHCDRATGACVHEPAFTECDDHDACTIDRCDPTTGACLSHDPIGCDDGNACTTDTCDAATGCAHTFSCGQEATDITIAFGSDIGKGSGTVKWNTTHEATVTGFNVIVLDQAGAATRINPVLIPCTECITGNGAHYEYIVPKHRSGRDIFIEIIGPRGSILGRFGPATKEH